MSEVRYRAAHLLLDALVGMDPDGEDAASHRAASLALDGIGGLGLVTFGADATIESVDLTPLLDGTLLLVELLATQVATMAGVDRLAVLARAREAIQDLADQ